MGNESKRSFQHVTETTQCHPWKSGWECTEQVITEPGTSLPPLERHAQSCRSRLKERFPEEPLKRCKTQSPSKGALNRAFLNKVQLPVTAKAAVTELQAQVLCGGTNKSCGFLQHLGKKVQNRWRAAQVTERENTFALTLSAYIFFLVHSTVGGFPWEPPLRPQGQAEEFGWQGHGGVRAWGAEGASRLRRRLPGETAVGGSGGLERWLQSLGRVPAAQKLRNHLSRG